MLHHRKQTERWGCIYHALYAVTGDASLLEYASDISEPRARIRLHHLGYTLLPVLEPDWTRYAEILRDGDAVHCILTISGICPGATHAVALELSGDGVTLSDSATPGLQRLTHTQFQLSRYASPLLTEMLIPLKLDAFPVQDAGQALNELLEHNAAQVNAAYAM